MLDGDHIMTLKCHWVMSQDHTPHAPINRVQMFTGWDANQRAKTLSLRLTRQVPDMRFWIETSLHP